MNDGAADLGQDSKTRGVLLAALAVGSMSQSFLFALVPPLGRLVGWTDVQIGAMAGVSALIFVFVTPRLGALSAQVGCIRVIRAGVAGATASSATFAAVFWLALQGDVGSVTAYAGIFAARLVLSISLAALLPAAMLYVAQNTSPSRRASAFAFLGFAWGVGAIAGPFLAWSLSAHSMLAPFYCSTGCTLLVLLLLFATPGLSATPSGSRSESEADGDLCALGPVLAVTLLTVLCSGLVQQLLAMNIQDVGGLDAAEAARRAGMVLMLMASATVAVQLGIGLKGQRLGPPSLLRVGCILLVAGVLCFLFADWRTPSPLYAGLILGTALGALFPGTAAVVAQIAAGPRQGRALGLNSAAQGLGMALGPMIGTALYSLDARAPFAFAAVAALLGLLTWEACQLYQPRQLGPATDEMEVLK